MFKGKRLKFYREKNNLTQAELGKIFNISDATINRYEKGQRQPDTDTLSKFADFFDISVDYLLGRTEDPQSKVLGKDELPKELIEIGIEYIEVIKEAQASDITPKDIKELIEFFKKTRK